MKRLFILLIFVLAFSAPAVQAQSLNPAAYLPSDLAAYVEMRVDDTNLAALNKLTSVGMQLSGMPAGMQIDLIDQMLAPAVSSIMPGMDIRADILPWVGDRIGVGVLNIPLSDPTAESNALIVLPIADATAARSFVAKLSDGASSESIGGVTIYKTNSVGVAVGADVIWLSTPSGIDALTTRPMLERLTDNPGYRQVRAALPEDAFFNAYISGAFLLDTFNQMTANMAPSDPSPAAIVEAVMRIHPAESAAEAALLANEGLNGVGLALQVSDDQIDATAVVSVDAKYAAPTLTSATAGAALLNLIPSDSFVVLNSYDVSVLALPIATLAYLGPQIGNTFNNLVAELNNATPPPTPTPTPTPTPAPPPTADDLIAQVQPIISQIESMMGMSLAQLYGLTNGEYAIAVFPGAGPTVGAALYVQSSDPQSLLDTIDHVSKLILVDPTAGTPLVGVEHQTIDGVDVALLGTAGAGDRPAVGIVGDNVLFVTMESSVAKVVAASTQPSTTPALDWRDSFGAAQDALLYVDIPTLDLYAIRQQPGLPPLPIKALVGSFDMRDNGLFVLNLTLTVAS